ncbi:MAG: cytochrome c [Acidobacteria bacterium]|nr:cytochrome c [Acidobacteriota bacterium]
MKRILQVTLVALFAVVAGLGFTASRPAAVALAEPSAEANLAGPYGTYCARCHGGDGRANTAKGRQLEADDLTDSTIQNMSTEKMTRIIKNGRGKMPAFKNLSARQIAQIIATVRSF